MSARWLAVARKDFADARRSRTLLALVVLYSALVALVVVGPGALTDLPRAEPAVWFVTLSSGLTVPLLALIASYLAIAGERESGSLKLLLGLPPTRRDVVLGKFVGRSAVVLLAVAVAFAVGAVGMVGVFGTLPAWPYLLAAGLTALLGLSFVGLAVGLSAASPSRSRAMAPAVGLYLIFGVLWSTFWQQIVPLLVQLGLDVEFSPETLTLLTVLSPIDAYGRLVDSTVLPLLLERLGVANVSLPVSPPDTAAAPWYLQDWVVLAVMVAWIVLPVVLGYWRFERADLA